MKNKYIYINIFFNTPLRGSVRLSLYLQTLFSGFYYILKLLSRMHINMTKSLALIYLIVKGACKVEFTCKVKVTCESYHCILQVNYVKCKN